MTILYCCNFTTFASNFVTLKSNVDIYFFYHFRVQKYMDVLRFLVFSFHFIFLSRKIWVLKNIVRDILLFYTRASLSETL